MQLHIFRVASMRRSRTFYRPAAVCKVSPRPHCQVHCQGWACNGACAAAMRPDRASQGPPRYCVTSPVPQHLQASSPGSRLSSSGTVTPFKCLGMCRQRAGPACRRVETWGSARATARASRGWRLDRSGSLMASEERTRWPANCFFFNSFQGWAVIRVRIAWQQTSRNLPPQFMSVNIFVVRWCRDIYFVCIPCCCRVKRDRFLFSTWRMVCVICFCVVVFRGDPVAFRSRPEIKHGCCFTGERQIDMS